MRLLCFVSDAVPLSRQVMSCNACFVSMLNAVVGDCFFYQVKALILKPLDWTENGTNDSLNALYKVLFMAISAPALTSPPRQRLFSRHDNVPPTTDVLWRNVVARRPHVHLEISWHTHCLGILGSGWYRGTPPGSAMALSNSVIAKKPFAQTRL